MDPRTILYVGNFQKPWCTEVHVAASLEALGHRVIRQQENETRWTGLPDEAEMLGAHMLLWTRTWPAEMGEVVPALAHFRDKGIPTVSYHLDRWFGLDREHQVRDQPFFHTALVVSPDDSPRWAEEGINHLWSPPGVFGPECGPVDPDPRRFPHEVVFVGSHPYPHPEWRPYRDELIDTFAKRFGRAFGVWPKPRQPIRGRDLQILYATAKVVIGDSCLAGESHRYWSDRVPETLGRGAVLIHPFVGADIAPGGAWYNAHGPATLVDDSDVPDMLGYELGDFEGAANMAARLLGPFELRWAIGEKGRETVLGRDTYEHRMATVLAEVERQFGWPDHPAPAFIAEPEPTPAPHPRMRARLGRWSSQWDPRPGDIDVDGGSFVVVDEVWARNDYRVPPGGFSGTVLDIGGNVGAFAVLAAKAGAKQVLTVEPHEGNRARLEHHLTINGLWPHTRGPLVQIEPRAVVGEVVAEQRLTMVGNGGGARLSPGADGPQVHTVALAQLIEQLAPIEFLKCDIEGGEYDAFSGVTANLLHEHVAAMALEFHGPVMPHLAHLDDGRQLERWGALVALLADCGHVEIHGHPTVGGLIHWRRF